MLRKLLKTDPNNVTLTILRLMLGVVFLAHGAQKLFSIGFANVASTMHGLGIPFPHEAAIVVTLVEFLGGIALILGVGVRWAALLLAIDMAVAVVKVHLPHGFFAQKSGCEYPLTLLAASIMLALAGPGCLALQGASRRGARR